MTSYGVTREHKAGTVASVAETMLSTDDQQMAEGRIWSL
jgi:hypothetical protein